MEEDKTCNINQLIGLQNNWFNWQYHFLLEKLNPAKNCIYWIIHNIFIVNSWHSICNEFTKCWNFCVDFVKWRIARYTWTIVALNIDINVTKIYQMENILLLKVLALNFIEVRKKRGKVQPKKTMPTFFLSLNIFANSSNFQDTYPCSIRSSGEKKNLFTMKV